MEQNNLQPKSGKLRLHEGVELPIDGLPIKVQAFINEVVRCYCCPIEFPTVAVIASASTVIGRRVKIFDGIYTNPLMLWFVNVANSGTNKTAPVKRAIKPLSIINSENYATYKPELDTWRANKERDESNPPKYDQLLINDSTEEARTQVLKSSTTGVLAHHPEIKGFFDDLDRYNKSGSISRVLRLIDGDELIVGRTACGVGSQLGAIECGFHALDVGWRVDAPYLCGGIGSSDVEGDPHVVFGCIDIPKIQRLAVNGQMSGVSHVYIV